VPQIVPEVPAESGWGVPCVYVFVGGGKGRMEMDVYVCESLYL
jgi:hypothetical protein